MIKNKWSITKTVSKGMFKAAPFSVLVTAGAWFLLALLPAMLVSVTAELLNSILLADLSGAKRGGLIFLLIYCVRYFLEFVYSITVNTGIYEKATIYFRIQLYEKMAKLLFVVYENAELLNVKDRAESAVSNEALSSLFSRFLQLVKAGVTLVSVSAVLLTYSGWLAVLAFVSIVPYFIIRIIRGREFYRVHSFQTKKRSQMDYLWELFHKQSTVKEMRALGFGDLVADIGGLDKRLGKEFGGQDLSKGQLQQLAIARGLYRMGNLLILDEPTAALDSIMENEILLRFLEKRKGQTTVIVSHRFGLCTKVDKIVVMDQGRIVECGIIAN